MWPSPSHWVEHCSGMAIDVVGAADAVREALDAARGVGAGVEHGVHRVGAPPPALLRAVHVEGLRQRERRRRGGPARRPRARLASSRKFRVPRTSSAPQRPQLETRSAAAAIAPSGSDRSRSRVIGCERLIASSSANVSATQSAMKALHVGEVVEADVLGRRPPPAVKIRSSRFGAVDRLVVGAVRVLERDLPVVLAVGDEERHGDLLDHAVEVHVVGERR